MARITGVRSEYIERVLHVRMRVNSIAIPPEFYVEGTHGRPNFGVTVRAVRTFLAEEEVAVNRELFRANGLRRGRGCLSGLSRFGCECFKLAVTVRVGVRILKRSSILGDLILRR